MTQMKSEGLYILPSAHGPSHMTLLFCLMSDSQPVFDTTWPIFNLHHLFLINTTHFQPSQPIFNKYYPFLTFTTCFCLSQPIS